MKPSYMEALKKARTVRIYDYRCGKPWFWAVDMPDMKRDIDEAVGRGARRGERVAFYEPGEEPTDEGYCKCGMPS